MLEVVGGDEDDTKGEEGKRSVIRDGEEVGSCTKLGVDMSLRPTDYGEVNYICLVS